MSRPSPNVGMVELVEGLIAGGNPAAGTPIYHPALQDHDERDGRRNMTRGRGRCGAMDPCFLDMQRQQHQVVRQHLPAQATVIASAGGYQDYARASYMEHPQGRGASDELQQLQRQERAGRARESSLWNKDTDLVLRDLVLRQTEVDWGKIASTIEWDTGAVSAKECKAR